ncbi:MAG: Tad domain-containing protein [Granulosicoccus sp.]
MKKQERGQVLPLGLVLIVMCIVGAMMLFNTSRVASDKMRLANSADAAAYSGALWQARALNYQAYANRAMVANQVAIGQAVSLQSWMKYAAMISQNLATALKPVPVLNMVTGGIDSAVVLAEKAVTLGAKTMLLASNAATLALSGSQRVMHAATLANTLELVSVVAKESDPRFTSNSIYGVSKKASNARQWLAFGTRYNRKNTSAMLERQQLIMQSRDTFTRARNWDLFDFWMPSGLRTLHKLRRQGATRLLSVRTPQGLQWEWVAKDTMSIQTKKYSWRGKKLSEFPVAWASAFANSRSSNRPINRQSCSRQLVSRKRTGQCINFTGDNHRAESYADMSVPTLLGKRTLIPISGYGGVRSFGVLSEEARSAEDARLTVKVEVSLPAQELRGSDAIVNAEQLSSSVVTAGNTLSSISAADVFYRRPQHHRIESSRREKANAYNPYWQAQLVPVSMLERGLALGLRSNSGAPASHSGKRSSEITRSVSLSETQGGVK